ncbi:uncharacterized protein [Spinacia oleracea]|uniref:Histone RNA hairpin-binding protein RNA-binding domain-containing protein n=1 Tax=Spinacia oleracea TaxID=3562 RepID=A0ABM3QR06_SPIOL|nr:uncharacterized protein LOC130461637 [Spinacia oleracea]
MQNESGFWFLIGDLLGDSRSIPRPGPFFRRMSSRLVLYGGGIGLEGTTSVIVEAICGGGVSAEHREEEIDPEDIPHADRILRYENSDGEEVVKTIPWASPPHRKSYDAIPEHYAPAPRVRVRRWMLLLDYWKRQCAKITRKLSSRNREERRRDRRDSVDREPQAETSLGQEGPSLELGQGSGAGAHQRHSDAERGASPFVHVDPTMHLFGGASGSRPFVPPSGYYFGGSSPQPWGAGSWACYAEMERMRQAQMFGSYPYMPMLPPYQYSSSQQGVQPSTGTLCISEEDPSTPGTELDRELKRLRRRNRDKGPVVDVTADDDLD